MKRGTARRSIALIALMLAIPGTAWANSSWRWLTQTRPYDVLPFVVAVTLLIEVLAIAFAAGPKAIWRALIAVVAANLLSFAAPYAVEFIGNAVNGAGHTFAEHLEHWPVYTVGLAYLLMTLAVEIPVVYCTLRKQVENRSRLMMAIILANTATTLMVALLERNAARGTW